MSIRSKIEQLRLQAEEAEAKVQENLARRNDLGQERRELAKERGNPHLPGGRLVEINRRMAAIGAETQRLQIEARRLGKISTRAAAEYGRQARRLEEARRTLNVIENPPPWGLGDHSPAQIRRVQSRARRAIAELTGR